MQKNNKLVILLASVLVLVAVLMIVLATRVTLTISADCEDTLYAEWGQEFTEPAVYAYGKKGFGDETSTLMHTTATVDTDTVGTYTLTYAAEYEGKTAEKTITVIVRDTVAPTIELTDGNEVVVQPGKTYTEDGYTASDNKDGDLTARVQTDVTADRIVYTVTDESGNSASVTRTIVYKDTEAPTITLIGVNEVLLEVGDTYTEQGATAYDWTDGDLTSKIEVEGTVDTAVPGSYMITYTVSDAAGNTVATVRYVLVNDSAAPELTLSGDTKYYINRGETYTDPGYSAIDASEGDLTSQVVVEGEVDTSKLGVYTLTYTCADAFGNTSTATREVYVFAKQADIDPNEAEDGNMVIYLTFDDGPGKYTQELLDVLDKYNVKVTFFVTNQFQNNNYLKMIKKCDDDGHTIGIHTYTHEYSQIYASDEAYFEDLFKMANLIKDLTGKDAVLMRFPGGSSNRISSTSCPGLMTRLTTKVQELGYIYQDWNVESGDSDGKSNKMEFSAAVEYVYQNTIKGITSRNGQFSVVLQHDIHEYSVAAVEKIILWGLENGYTFRPLTENSPVWHHHVNN